MYHTNDCNVCGEDHHETDGLGLEIVFWLIMALAVVGLGFLVSLFL